jgi:hypothetical protein
MPTAKAVTMLRIPSVIFLNPPPVSGFDDVATGADDDVTAPDDDVATGADDEEMAADADDEEVVTGVDVEPQRLDWRRTSN